MKGAFFYLFSWAMLMSCSNASERPNNADAFIDIVAEDLKLEQRSNGLFRKSLEDAQTLTDGENLLNLLQAQSNMLVLRINDTNCSLCVETEIQVLKELTHFIALDQMMILATFKSKRNLRLLLSELENLDIAAFTIPQGVLELPADAANSPYYFTLNRDMQVNHVFLPIRGLTRYNQAYFEGIGQVLKSPSAN